MGLLTINLPGVGPYLRTTAWVSTPYHRHPPRPNVVYNVRVAGVEVDLISSVAARTRLLTHARLYRDQLANPARWNIVVTDPALVNALPAQWLNIQEDNSDEIALVDSYIRILHDPETRFLKDVHVQKGDPLYY